MHKILITSQSFGKNSQEPIKYLQDNQCELHFVQKGHLKSEELVPLIKGIDGMIIGIDQVDRKVIEASDQLKIICMHGTGTDHIDVEAATKKGILVANAPGGNNNAVAELTVGLMLNITRHIHASDASIRKYQWKRKIGSEITGKKIGIVGVGNIGGRVIELLAGFDVEVLAYDRSRNFKFENGLKGEYVSLEQLIKESDIISLHLPLNEQTQDMISKNELEMMKNTAYLINTSRGGLINEADLYDALVNQKIAGAALDAFEHEPLQEDSKLRELENVVMTAHIAASTYESANLVDKINAETIVSVLLKNKNINVINNKKSDCLISVG